jgi:hypothetical protein
MRRFKKLTVSGLAYTVWIATPEECPLLKSAEGYCDFDGHIYIRQDVAKDPTRFRDTYVHELTHAWLHASGFETWFAGVTGIESEDELAKVTESFIRMQTPILIATLTNAGLFKKRISK